MDISAFIKGVCFCLQTTIGVVGNSIIVKAFIQVAINERKMVPVENITSHLAFVNMILLLTRGIPQTMAAFGLQNILNHHGCVLIVFIYATVRALSVCITCLLSLFQSVSIAPTTCVWKCLRSKIPQYLIPCSIILWFVNMAASSGLLLYTTVPQNGTVSNYAVNMGYCYVRYPDKVVYNVYGTIYTGRDIVIVFTMVAASSYILLTLYRHSKQVKGIRSSNHDPKTTAEVKAAKTVLCLVTLYVTFYGIDNIILIYVVIKMYASTEIADLRVFFSSVYASLSPFVIIKFNRKIRKSLCSKHAK
ncbi:olfactory receptor class A-like protein 1 [Protopterus annectens]|uniref:olfactory receptor class A-like protein 1 n=1 Tax=Protopterus annectens TaxID=7888 RepID=UPI001CF97C35|nr:olfactory receptor class A-like protein 1 [Protopterus annectens]